MLFLISTPIGNLADFSFRAISTIESCDYLLCEDTRRSHILLNHYNLKKPLKSFHLFNERNRTEEVIADLKGGMTIGLLSDAGTPCISDPGFQLVHLCRELDLDVVPIPGACALIAALAASGLDATCFQFIGFLPKKKGKRTALEEALAYPGTTVCYESPFRMKATLQQLAALDPERKIVIGREITKKFEQFYRGTPSSLLPLWEKEPPKGEFVLMISGLV